MSQQHESDQILEGVVVDKFDRILFLNDVQISNSVGKNEQFLVLHPQQITQWIEHIKQTGGDIHPSLLYQANTFQTVQNYWALIEACTDGDAAETHFTAAMEIAAYSIKDTFSFFDKYFQSRFGSSIEEHSFRHEDQEAVRHWYMKLLCIPHLRIDDTWSSYSAAVSDFSNGDYHTSVEMMKEGSKFYNSSKSIVAECEIYEVRLAENKDSYNGWLEYLKHLRRLYHKAKATDGKLLILKIIVSIFERSLGSDLGKIDEFLIFWIEFIKILKSLATGKVPMIVQQLINSQIHEVYLPKLTKYYEDSYLSWATYLKYQGPRLVSSTFFDYVRTHLLKVAASLEDFSQWNELICQILIFELKGTSVDLDYYMEKIYEDCAQFMEVALINRDPALTVERLTLEVYIKLEDIEEARSVTEKIISASPDRHWAWLTCIDFEKRFGNHETISKLYHTASKAVLQLEWPEPILNEWLIYEQMYGTAESYSFAERQRQYALESLWEARSAEIAEPTEDVEEILSNKRNIEKDEEEIESPKKLKKMKVENSRDREHLKIKVTNLPSNINEQELEAFFVECGAIRDIKLLNNQAIIEFSSESGVLASLTKTYKKIRDSEIRVDRVINNTVFVTNFSPSETEETLKLQFEQAGTVISIRFPSLKYNVDRRFCYIEFATSKEALAAVEKLDHKQLRNEFPHPLTVKISNPKEKHHRSKTAAEEGRELYLNNLDFFKVDASLLEKSFGAYGKIQKIHLPLSHKSVSNGRKNDGFGFITFETADEATRALEMDMAMDFGNRPISVSVSDPTKQGAKKKIKKVIENFDTDQKVTGDISNRIISLLDLPDTVNVNQLVEYVSEKIGPVNKVDLRSIDSVALVEFKKVEDAGKAGLVLNGETLQGKMIRVGTRQDFDRLKTAKKPVKNKMMVPTNVIRRKRR
ncbi:U6 snRNP complex subunit [Saccharomycopsis crataegensis]|uniref:U6 snRNP complex subunit n=1 Tax=Saccharomycopsis crataegensis TaxID=43959 RepID=A0AAV5QW68_9ASCO|nr:U6 snRNP complex subunit [Saccharomycopsis crataegensis]